MKRAGLYLICSAFALNAGMTNAAESFTPENGANIGNATQSWLAMQADGSAAAPSAPMPGVQASAAYTRYLKSFDKPIPDHFGSTVKDGGAVSSGS
jgi:hypothetical protein